MSGDQLDAEPNEMKSVSVIVPTYNSERVLGECLESLRLQEVAPLEVIVSDGGSTDHTIEIANQFGATVIEMEANRSAQRNAGARHASGNYLLFVDSDMCVTPMVIAECLQGFSESQAALVIPEVFLGTGFWGKVRGFERTFYDGVWYIEAARWYRRHQFLQVGGFDARLVGPEDWDLDQRIRQFGSVGRINAVIEHNEGYVRFAGLLGKKGHYAESFPMFREFHPERAALSLSTRRRMVLFLRKPTEIIRHPALSIGVGVLGATEILVSQRWSGGWLRSSNAPERRAV
ncbi:MAG: glycosyltransferase family 2 protein [Ferrimicrobium sp.]